MIERDERGQFILTETCVLSCGCHGTGPKINRMLRSAGVQVTILNTNLKPRAKKAIKNIGLDLAVPSLRGSKYAVLYNPNSTKFMDLLNAPETEQVFENIRSVVND